ncbi:glycosyl hydrolase family 10 [Chroococcidiopsis sp. CCALA 051]|uniref:endo-1,4-beta-xylanase n=1 Tax=Chroococcidiopsis sp. CCALA 051 TaxID=869949 RepID=UPI000D0D1ACF|nr:endo-1,4-beta-xylanase [Chroococcidiopsis sp. CCALA 051]MBE9014706.1 endo-1,4-beta-xylanase [Chroococcidiopsidales cyanobacterium LEGE 13417]PSM48699.1 glycosyl hydrolase family 10 [Chroococcidiopsis sp. CCALA 051]
MTGRRRFLLGLGALAGVGAGASQAQSGYDRQILAADTDAAIENASLREWAAAKGLVYGAATQEYMLSSNPQFASSFVRECAMLVPEDELKWKSLRPSPNRFDFTRSDRLAQFAKTHNLLFRGHTLLWHARLPSWFKSTVNHRNARQIMLEHITKVAGHYAGQMHSWDVVNEAVFPEDGRSDSLRITPWLRFLGSDYLDIAFRAAFAADPQALLVYNDYGMEYDTPKDEAKRTAVLKLLERLRSQGTPVQALGIQAHLWGGETRFNPSQLRAFLKDVASLGLKILITELDVTDKHLPSDIHLRDRLVAGVYQDYLSVVLDEPAVIAVITWGLSDRYTWLSQKQARRDGGAVRPLPLDANMRRKEAWKAIARAFKQATPL